MHLSHLYAIIATMALVSTAAPALNGSPRIIDTPFQAYLEKSTWTSATPPTVDQSSSSAIIDGIAKLSGTATTGIVHAAKRQLGLVYEDLKSLNATMTSELDNIANAGKIYGGEAYHTGGVFLGYSEKLHAFMKKATYAPFNVSSEMAETMTGGLTDTFGAWNTYTEDLQGVLSTNPGFARKISNSVSSTSSAIEEAIAAYKKYIKSQGRLALEFLRESL